MMLRLLGESFARNPRRKLLAAAALMLGMCVATATLSVALEVGDHLEKEFRSYGANLVVSPRSDTLPLEIGGVDYRPVDEGAYLREADLQQVKEIFWRHNIVGMAPFLDVPASASVDGKGANFSTTLAGTWYKHRLTLDDGSGFTAGVATTHPWWQVRGEWFGGENECVVGIALAGRYHIAPGDVLVMKAGARTARLKVMGILTTGDAEENSVVAPLEVAQALGSQPEKVRRIFVSALTKPPDLLSERDPNTLSPADYDRWFCSPYASSIAHQIEQILPGTEVHPIRRVADSEGRILTHVGGLLWLVTLGALGAAALAVGATSATTVLERRSEVGLMKALGAGNWLVGTLFLGEQLILAFAGGTVGFLAGLVLARVLAQSVFGVAAEPRFILYPAVLGLAGVVAVAGSLWALRSAMRVEPAPILRGE